MLYPPQLDPAKSMYSDYTLVAYTRAVHMPQRWVEDCDSQVQSIHDGSFGNLLVLVSPLSFTFVLLMSFILFFFVMVCDLVTLVWFTCFGMVS